MGHRYQTPGALPLFNASADYTQREDAPPGRCAHCGGLGGRVWVARNWMTGQVRYAVCRSCLSLLRCRPTF